MFKGRKLRVYWSNHRNKVRVALKNRFLVLRLFLNSKKDFRKHQLEFTTFLKARNWGFTGETA